MRRSGPAERLVLVRTSDPATEPLSLGDAKEHLRVDYTDDDDLISGLVTAARQHVEETTARALITQTWTLKLDSFPPDTILLPRPPLQSVTSITYLDSDGNSQTLSSDLYDVHTGDVPGRVTRGYNDTWPLTRGIPNAVTVTFVAGYGAAAADVPAPIVHAMKLWVADAYRNREETITGTVVARMRSADALLAPYRVRWF